MTVDQNLQLSVLQPYMRELEARVANLPVEEMSYLAEGLRTGRSEKIKTLIAEHGRQLSPAARTRVEAEFSGYGPLENLMADEGITEILVNGYDNLWFEKNGKLARAEDVFVSARTYRQCVQRLCEASRTHLTVEHPMTQGSLEGFRLQIVGAELTRSELNVSLRRHPKNPWNFESLAEKNWARPEAFDILRDWLAERKNFLVVGPTGSGKTSVTNACMQALPPEERVLILEDTQELCLPNPASQRLLTREDPQRLLPEIGMGELLRQSLRMRPDRLVLGEVRSLEAKDFLMALSTGHAGSFGTLHASSPHQALIRLEMLIQLGAPNWGLSAIRRLIYLSLNGIVIAGRKESGERVLMGIHQITSLEEHGFLIEKVY